MRRLVWSVVLVSAVACASATGDEAPEVITGGSAGAATAGTGGSVASGGEASAGSGGSALPDGGSFPDGSTAGTAGGSQAGSAGQSSAGSAGQPAAGAAGQAQAGQAQAGQAQAGQSQAGQGGQATGPCAGKADGDVCDPTTAVCKVSGVCVAGSCKPQTNKPDGSICDDPKNPCQQPGVCAAGACGAPKARADNYGYDPANEFALCCGGQPTKVTSATNCGACGIGCNASNGESCQARTNAGQTNYYCAGCVASAACWSGCCSTSFPASMNVCAASDCKGGCTSKCPAGTHCQSGASVMMSNWCQPD